VKTQAACGGSQENFTVECLGKNKVKQKGKIIQTVCRFSGKKSWRHTDGWDLLEQLGMEKKAENSFVQFYPSLEGALPL